MKINFLLLLTTTILIIILKNIVNWNEINSSHLYKIWMILVKLKWSWNYKILKYLQKEFTKQIIDEYSKEYFAYYNTHNISIKIDNVFWEPLD